MEDLKFTQEIKDNWLKALKSGEYIQDAETLSCDGKHCCLGVLAEITTGMSIDDEGYSLLHEGIYYGADDRYGILADWFGRDMVEKLWNTNDTKCDGKYTAVIPLIENLEVDN